MILPLKKQSKKVPLKLIEYEDLSPNERKKLYKLYEEDKLELRKCKNKLIHTKRKRG